MKVYVYILAADGGFAPNPFFGWCTLACCKPAIRRRAQGWRLGRRPDAQGRWPPPRVRDEGRKFAVVRRVLERPTVRVQAPAPREGRDAAAASRRQLLRADRQDELPPAPADHYDNKNDREDPKSEEARSRRRVRADRDAIQLLRRRRHRRPGGVHLSPSGPLQPRPQAEPKASASSSSGSRTLPPGLHGRPRRWVERDRQRQKEQRRMRLILSRKGFDSANGGCPSPIFPDGSMLSLPIPSRSAPHRYSLSLLARAQRRRPGRAPQSEARVAAIMTPTSTPTSAATSVRVLTAGVPAFGQRSVRSGPPPKAGRHRGRPLSLLGPLPARRRGVSMDRPPGAPHLGLDADRPRRRGRLRRA